MTIAREKAEQQVTYIEQIRKNLNTFDELTQEEREFLLKEAISYLAESEELLLEVLLDQLNYFTEEAERGKLIVSIANLRLNNLILAIADVFAEVENSKPESEFYTLVYNLAYELIKLEQEEDVFKNVFDDYFDD